MPKGTGIPLDEAVPLLVDALAGFDEDGTPFENRLYEQEDVWRWFERNKRMTGRYPAVWPATLRDVKALKKVPNEPFRNAWKALNRAMILGEPVDVVGSHEGSFAGGAAHEPEWCGLFRDELLRVRALPEALDFPTGKIGPSDLSCAGLSSYLRSTLGIEASTGRGNISLTWLVQYEVAEALHKALGLVPHQVGI